ncbi:MAG: hypothetical protein KGI38_12035 [Thaumarchaeota archaeon]|nr:hypothetical protein [Nitrososphaerota archaeon]
MEKTADENKTPSHRRAAIVLGIAIVIIIAAFPVYTILTTPDHKPQVGPYGGPSNSGNSRNATQPPTFEFYTAYPNGTAKLEKAQGCPQGTFPVQNKYAAYEGAVALCLPPGATVKPYTSGNSTYSVKTTVTGLQYAQTKNQTTVSFNTVSQSVGATYITTDCVIYSNKYVTEWWTANTYGYCLFEGTQTLKTTTFTSSGATLYSTLKLGDQISVTFYIYQSIQGIFLADGTMVSHLSLGYSITTVNIQP